MSCEPFRLGRPRMKKDTARLLANVQLLHGTEAAKALRDLVAAGDEDFAVQIGSASLTLEFVREKLRTQESMRDQPRRRRRKRWA
jgi:hypothetical protein